jgi:hypothetical protein
MLSQKAMILSAIYSAYWSSSSIGFGGVCPFAGATIASARARADPLERRSLRISFEGAPTATAFAVTENSCRAIAMQTAVASDWDFVPRIRNKLEVARKLVLRRALMLDSIVYFAPQF